MKIAEALIRRSDLQKKVGELRERINNSLYIVEGEDEGEDVAELFTKANDTVHELEDLIRRVNKTNMATVFEAEGVSGTIMDAPARRESLSMRSKTVTEAISNTSSSGRRRLFYDDRAPGKLTVSVANLRREADELAAQIRRLDLAIQQVNWNTEVL